MEDFANAYLTSILCFFALRAHIVFGAAMCPSIFFTFVVRDYCVANEIQAKFPGLGF